jgi:hypothetical protein
MLSQSITVAKTTWSFFHEPIKAVARKAHIRIFQFCTRKPPFDELRAKQIAFSVLAGDVVRAVSYRNIDSRRVFIACLRRSSEGDYDSMLYILEQIGDAFKIVCTSDRLFFFEPSNLVIGDVDRDGNYEVSFEDWSSGSGAGMRRLMLYCSRRARLFTITESREWQNRTGPISPVIDIEPECDPEMLRNLEDLARKRGYLQPLKLVDFDKPEFAVQRWHKENGKKVSGGVRIHYYQGPPDCKASVMDTLDTSAAQWISFFKGPLCGYEKTRDRHFIAYSPAWSYRWAKCLAFDNEVLWFGLHCRGGLMSFRLGDSFLQSYESFQGTDLPYVEKLEIDHGVLVLNGRLTIPVEALIGGPSVFPH